jgi:hypothetical protein
MTQLHQLLLSLVQAVLDRCEDFRDRRSLRNRHQPTVDYEKFRAELGFDD